MDRDCVQSAEAQTWEDERIRAMLALTFAIYASACGPHSDCNKIIDKMVVCDPSASSASRAILALQCINTSPRCVALPTPTPIQCAEFMGCLYGD
jgi:hypothetical protein